MTNDDRNYLDLTERASFNAALQTTLQQIKVHGSIANLSRELENVGTSLTGCNKLAKEHAVAGVTYQGAPAALVDGIADQFFVLLDQPPTIGACPENKDPLLWNDGIDEGDFDMVLLSLGSKAGCARLARVQQVEIGVGPVGGPDD